MMQVVSSGASAAMRSSPSPAPSPSTSSQDRSAAVGITEAPLARSDLDARREALDIPLERALERLVEIVEVEEEVTLG